ncbi:hypothetical protein ACIQU6_29105 [Streptomyces sp. NPDC090442]|uniref:hypothetical protein n=1 Tax=Streptomyces sp. NPDC090442 TaxID=3365962 RepID=UPI00380ABCB9
MAMPGSTSPDLGKEIALLKRRITALERKPVPQTVFDQYPATEVAAIPRVGVEGNSWSSVGVANVTGLKFDRVECRFNTYAIRPNVNEVEVRLAAFRHNIGSGAGPQREIVSASGVMLLPGDPRSDYLGQVGCRWLHQIEYGWDYSTGHSVYTVELQFRYHSGLPKAPASNRDQIAGFWKRESDPDPGLYLPDVNGRNVIGAPKNFTRVVWATIPDQYPPEAPHARISNMHYCVGVSQDRAPDASVNGWWTSTGAGNARYLRGPDIAEPEAGF